MKKEDGSADACSTRPRAICTRTAGSIASYSRARSSCTAFAASAVPSSPSSGRSQSSTSASASCQLSGESRRIALCTTGAFARACGDVASKSIRISPTCTWMATPVT